MNRLPLCLTKLFTAFLAVAMTSVFFTGCATVNPERKDFLTSYAGMRKKSDLDDAIVNDRNAAKLQFYDKVIIDEVRVFHPTGKNAGKVSAADLRNLENEFRSALHTEIGKHYAISSTPGPGTLRLRAAVVDIQAGDPFWHAVGYAPFVTYASSAAQLATGSGFGGGYATAQVELLDSVTGEQIFAGIDKNTGSKLEIVEGLSKWGHVQKAFSAWAKELVKYMEAAHEASM